MTKKTVCLISGGIDSPVAGALTGKKTEIIPLHFVLHPYYCKETFSLSIKTIRRLRKVVSFKEIALFPWGNVLQKILENLEEINEREYSCVLCRRGMFKAASLICDRLGASSITTGEALGQKASQTLENLRTTSWNIKYPILRPLAGMDKDEIVKRSKKLGLYMSNHAGCCDATPENPRTKTEVDEVERLAEEVGLEEIVDNQSKEVEIYDVNENSFQEIFHDYLTKLID